MPEAEPPDHPACLGVDVRCAVALPEVEHKDAVGSGWDPGGVPLQKLVYGL
jgi:hypothetical protein